MKGYIEILVTNPVSNTINDFHLIYLETSFDMIISETNGVVSSRQMRFSYQNRASSIDESIRRGIQNFLDKRYHNREVRVFDHIIDVDKKDIRLNLEKLPPDLKHVFQQIFDELFRNQPFPYFLN